MDAGPDATVFLGLRDDVDPQRDAGGPRGGAARRRRRFRRERHVARWPARRHDHFLIPAGTVHCSGANAMVLEVSATPYIFTFKLWDWDRPGLDGLPRPINLAHGAANIQWDRRASWVRQQLINRVTDVARGHGWREERTGLHDLEFIETRRHWFTRHGAARHARHGARPQSRAGRRGRGREPRPGVRRRSSCTTRRRSSCRRRSAATRSGRTARPKARNARRCRRRCEEHVMMNDDPATLAHRPRARPRPSSCLPASAPRHRTPPLVELGRPGGGKRDVRAGAGRLARLRARRGLRRRASRRPPPTGRTCTRGRTIRGPAAARTPTGSWWTSRRRRRPSMAS